MKRTHRNMTREEFRRAGALLFHGDLLALGFGGDAIENARHPIADGEKVPFGKIGALKLPSRHCKRKANAHWRYRKSDVARLLNWPEE